MIPIAGIALYVGKGIYDGEQAKKTNLVEQIQASRISKLEQKMLEAEVEKNSMLQRLRDEKSSLEDELDDYKHRVGEYKAATKSKYSMMIVDDSISVPFKIDARMIAVADEMAKIDDEVKRAKAIFDWVEKNIEYDYSDNVYHSYRDSVEVEKDGVGVCGEQAYLYTVMARRAGLMSGYVSVDVDAFGKDVDHACSWVMADGKRILVDPAYKRFGLKHQKYRYLTDSQATFNFNAWRRPR